MRPLPLSRQSSAAPSGATRLVGGELPPFVSTAASLGIVLGVFLMVVWAVRRGTPKGAGLLPREAVEVLGRAPLAGRQQVQLVRCGNKLVLLSVAPGAVEPLTEICDPEEVDRLQALCQPHGFSRSIWRQWFTRFTSQSRPTEYLVREQSEDVDFGHLDVSGHRRS